MAIVRFFIAVHIPTATVHNTHKNRFLDTTYFVEKNILFYGGGTGEKSTERLTQEPCWMHCQLWQTLKFFAKIGYQLR